MHRHLETLLKRYPALECCGDAIEQTATRLAECYSNGGKVLACGNGGSAADAEHFAGELLKGFYKTRPLTPGEQQQVGPDYAERLQGALPTIPLVGFPAMNTAFMNDNDPDLLFAQLVWGLGRKGDALIGFSTSGNSENVVHAIKVARAKGLVTLALTGRDGGVMADLVDICILAPSEITHEVQEYHQPIYHCIALMLEEKFFQ